MVHSMELVYLFSKFIEHLSSTYLTEGILLPILDKLYDFPKDNQCFYGKKHQVNTSLIIFY